MLILGILVILVGVALILLGIFSTEVNSVNGAGQLEMLNFDINPTTLFILGLVSGIAILLGLGIVRFGAKRGLKQRKENKKMEDLSEKLDRVDADRRNDLDANR